MNKKEGRFVFVNNVYTVVKEPSKLTCRVKKSVLLYRVRKQKELISDLNCFLQNR
jgi:hypothetical protein